MTTHSRPHRAFIALGSNIHPEDNLPAAVRQLARLGEVAAASRVYESPPLDGSDQPNYLNAAALLLTDLTAESLCRSELPVIEAKLGRNRDPDNKHAPRTIDLDLVLYDNEMLTIDHRRIPDPELAARPFLAIPLAELDPNQPIPGTNFTLGTLAQTLAVDGTLTRRHDVELGPHR